MNTETKNCQNCKKDFVIEEADSEFYKKIGVPAPTFCPKCRMVRKMAFRNERSLYSRNCDLCGKSMIAMYSPDKPFKIYCTPCYFSDKWDPMSYGIEYDFSKPFFKQWIELITDVPRVALLQENTIDSPWINYEFDSKNCYLNVGGHMNEDSAYTQYGKKCRNVFDCFWPMGGQFVYGTTLSENCYKTFYSTLVYDCRDTYFSFDCRNCSNIIGCTGLRHKQYQIFNEQVSKEYFEAFLKEHMGSRRKIEALKEKAKQFWRSQPQRAVFIDKSTDCTGNLLKECKNCTECWMTEKTEDSKWQIFSLDTKDSYDIFSVWQGETCYDMLAGYKLANVYFSTGILESTDIAYCSLVRNCQSCFGCVNVRSKKYCILNRQYSQEEFEELRTKIREQMMKLPFVDKKGRKYSYGEFFPYEASPYGYNETVASEYFPKTKEEIINQGFNYSEFEPEHKRGILAEQSPDNIADVSDDILKQVLESSETKKPYRLIPMELEFYKRWNLPVPVLAPFERHRKRLSFIADHLALQERKCGKCGKAVQSVYNESEFPTVYCDDCYHQTIA